MEHEITERNSASAKSTLTTIVKFTTTLCAIFAAIWLIATLFHQHTHPLAGFSGVGLMLGLLVAISALNARLRIQLEEPDSEE